MTIQNVEQAVIAAVDVGSNSIKMTVARPTADGELIVLADTMETVRLGAGVPTTGRLAEDRMTAALATLRRFATIAREQGATRLIGVATEAVRRASNGHAFLDHVKTETGWQVRLISGDEEAMLTFRGLATDIDLTGLLFVADIGGASTEVIIAHDGQIMQAKSLQLGSGSLTEAHIVADPPTGAEVNACQSAAAATLLGIDLSPTQGATLVVVGGTGTYL
ncbi:MAG TPA: hypothetical protein PK819_03570, partial [Thermomicrobiales bacterium]|nr:hypothetical protein [Thermomicrobiales bacterium]